MKPHGIRVANDDITLRRLGKRPLLTRSFGFMSILGLSCSALSSWEAILNTSVPALLEGGPGAVVWSFIIGWIGTISVTATLGEMSSMAPTAGGQYHWIAMLCPPQYVSFLSYMAAWLTALNWQALSIASAYGSATVLQGIIVLARPSYEPMAYQTILIMWGWALFATSINMTTGRLIARFEAFTLVLHLVGFFGVLIPLVYLAPHNSAAFVFKTFYNNGGWPNMGLAFLVGLPPVTASLVGADCAVHMAEEIQAAAIVVPRSMMYTIWINGSLAFATILAVLFCITDLDAAIAAQQTMFYPWLQIFQSGVNSTTGACLMAGIVFVLQVLSTVGTYACASRSMWSFARDKGMPGSKYLVRITGNNLPTNTIITSMFITVLLSLLALANSVALAAITSLFVAATSTTYLMSCTLLLWRRCTGGIRPYSELGSHSGGIDGGPEWGPWKVPEPLGTINNAIACVWNLFLLFWSFWPQQNHPTAETVNWSVLVFGAVVLGSLIWYFVRARHYFKGPIKEA
ncbi:amino acid transporter [Xylariomycetidae sp. FL2044]|nr:amino acid transporter [Xylariomycetidae sp. FL2044]